MKVLRGVVLLLAVLMTPFAYLLSFATIAFVATWFKMKEFGMGPPPPDGLNS